MNSELELAPSRPMALAGVNVEALLNKAIDAKSAVEVMQALQTMRREIRAEEAEAAFDAALSSFQAEVPIIVKDRDVKDNSGTKAYSYTPLESVIQQVKPLLQKHGFNFTLDTDVESKDGWVIAKCTVTHNMGAKRTSTAKFPLGSGTRMMSTTQIYAAALTFASRRVFCNAFGIVTGGEDNDGAGRVNPAGPSQIAGDKAASPESLSLKRQLWDATKAIHNGDVKRLEQHLWDEGFMADTEFIASLPATRIAQILKKVKHD